VIAASPREGDVFLVRVDAGRRAVGQVVGTYKRQALFMAVYGRLLHSSEDEIHMSLESPLDFLALSFDAKIAVGDWPIVGRHPIPDHVVLPAFKEAIDTPENIYVVDASGSKRRPATPDESLRLRNRTIVAPAVLEHAIRARHGLEPWREEFDALVPDLEMTTPRLFDLGLSH
jgi:hypothetical protein